jgi:hypothetical protein
MKFEVSSAKAEMERKFEPEVKGLKDELQTLKDEHVNETAAFEKYQRETQAMIDEQHDIRAQLECYKRANEIRAQLICFIEEHVDSAGMTKIKEASRKLKIAKRSIEMSASKSIGQDGAALPRHRPTSRSRSTDRGRTHSRELPAAAAAATAATAREEDGWSTSRSWHSSRSLSARSTPPAERPGPAGRGPAGRSASFSAVRSRPPPHPADDPEAEPEPKFNFGPLAPQGGAAVTGAAASRRGSASSGWWRS